MRCHVYPPARSALPGTGRAESDGLPNPPLEPRIPPLGHASGCDGQGRSWHGERPESAGLAAHRQNVGRAEVIRRAAQPVIEAGLQDPDSYVRGQANAAADDVEWYLGWELAGREDKRGQPVCRR